MTLSTNHHAAATHDDTGVATTDPLIQARTVVADCIHYPDHEVIEACGAVIAESPDPIERKGAALLMNFMNGDTQ